MTTGPTILDARQLASDPELETRFAESARQVLADLVSRGAALGWVEPPSRDEVAELLGHVTNVLHLYRSVGFTEYGRLPDFVAIGERRYDKVFYLLDLRQQG